MNPSKFKGQNVTFAENQPEYLPLPALVCDDQTGTVISCWRLTWRERFKIFFTGKLWLSQLTFFQSLQPQLPAVDQPFTFANEKRSKTTNKRG